MRMNDGTDVRIRGRLDWYSPRGAAPAADDGDRPRLHARPARAGPGRAARPAPGGGPAAGQRRARAAAGAAPRRAGHQRGLRGRGRLPRRAPPQRLRVPRAPGRLAGAGLRRAAVDRLRDPHARHPPARRARPRAGRRRPHRPGRLRRRGGGAGDRRVPGPGAHRHRSRGRHLGGRRGGAHLGQDAHRVRAAARGTGRRAGRRARGHAGRPSPSEACARCGATTIGCVLHARHLARGTRVALDGGEARLASIADRSRRAAVAGLDRASHRLDGHRGRITGRGPLAPPRRGGARRRRASAASPTAPHEPWPRPSGRSRRLEARLRAPRPGSHPRPRLVDHTGPRRLGRPLPRRRAARRPAHHPRRRRRPALYGVAR